MNLEDQALVQELRLHIGTTDLTDTQLLDYLTVNGRDIDATASRLWAIKASGYAELVDVKEGSSSRSLSKLYDQALAMSAHYRGIVELAAGPRRSTTRPIDRA